MYREFLMNNADIELNSTQVTESSIHPLSKKLTLPWKKRRCYWLVCDLALILLEESKIKEATIILCKYLSKRTAASIDKLFVLLWNDDETPASLSFTKELLCQFRANRRFLAQPLKRILVTATMSAGKSTLINSLMGKDLLEARNEACTGSVYSVFNKPFDDHILKQDDNSIAIYIEAFKDQRICLIDTPGVNSAKHPTHCEITKAEIEAGKYDVITYIFNAKYIGTIDDDNHLRYVINNIPRDTQIVFVLNQLDAFKEEDSIDDTINELRKHLEVCGVPNPIICPISAKAGLLAEKVCHDVELSKYEQRWYEIYEECFATEDLDLSRYYDEPYNIGKIPLLRQCGLKGLEEVLLKTEREGY